MEQTLTKEHFWNEMEAKFPKQMEIFKLWIDSYKIRIGWNKLFAFQRNCASGSCAPKYPKFHELPLAFQYGIFIQFFNERELEGQEPFNIFKANITERFSNLNK